MNQRYDHTAGVAVGSRSAETDEALYLAFLGGDDRAYTELYGRYERKVLTYLRTILRDHPAAADDAFQEAFIRLYRERKRRDEKGDEYNEIASVRSWLFRVAHNLAISYLRKRKKTVAFSETGEDDRVWDERLMTTVEESFSDHYGETDPLRDEELYERLLEAVEMLPAALREIYVLREINGLPYDEITQVADCTYEAARMRLSRARKALRTALSPYLKQP